jgi:CRISPR-associated endonuclease/helicase Cas3
MSKGLMTTAAPPSAGRVLTTVERLIDKPLYRWQRRLLVDYLLKGDIPDAVDVPTGLGKTTIIALWLAALSHGAALPRRLIYVVDRRAVVDQATKVANELVDALGDGASSDPTIVACREGLGLDRDEELPVSTLRGQHVDNRAWLADLSRPSIVVATVDMIGSRLLFSGYGVSPRMRSVHAGLLGADALLVLDEAHLVPPFEALMRQVQELRRSKQAPEVPPFRVMALSATGRTQAPHVFRLEPADWEKDPTAHERFHAAKRVKLMEPVPAADLAAALARHAWNLAAPAGAAVLVFCDSRKVAQDVYQLLKKQLRDTFGKDVDATELMVGERRVRERTQLESNRVFQRFVPQRHKNPSADVDPWPAFLIATSAGEVGVDLDADHIVCDLVALERMIQRLGRINRRPEPAADARIIIIPALLDRKKHDAEDISPAAQLARLSAPFNSGFWPIDADGWRDASPAQLYHLKSEPRLADILVAAETQEPLRPALVAAVIESWAMTSLDQHSARPDVQPWLRGWENDDEPQTRIVWRRHFPLRAADARDARGNPRVRRELLEFFEAAPPHLSEALDAPTSRVIDVLRKRAESWVASDDAGRASAADDPPHDPVVVILSPNGEPAGPPYNPSRLLREKPDALGRLLANRTVVVDARLGGLDDQGLLSHAADEKVVTLDGGQRAWDIDLTETAGFLVRRDDASSDEEGERTKKWRVEHRWYSHPEDDDEQSIVLLVEVWRDRKRAGADAFARGTAALAKVDESLEKHHARMLQWITTLGRRLNLSAPYIAMLRFVACTHDLGKVAEQWQNAMGAPRRGRPYAKTSGRCVPKMLEIAGETYRHELGSLREALQHPALMEVAAELRPLALHLIAAHHGFARPVIAPCHPEALQATCESIARDAAKRFHEVQAQWGPWELAWWESLVRIADWQASAESGQDEENA